MENHVFRHNAPPSFIEVYAYCISSYRGMTVQPIGE